MPLRHFTIPVFIPMEACPFRCIYCDQTKISGHVKIPDSRGIQAILHRYLSTIPANNCLVEVGFFGGTFTGLDMAAQEQYLKIIQPFIREGKIHSIRLSTRPDFLNQENVDFLKKFHVSTIELGAQSMDDEVLWRSGRGHTAADVSAAAYLIQSNGLRLGLQMMIGLPGDSPEKSLFTAKKFVELGVADVRIYPTLVVKGTHLENLFIDGKYRPLSLDTAVTVAADILLFFELNHVNVIRVGLHPSEGLLSGDSLVAGPFHVSFRELVNTKIWGDQFKEILHKENGGGITVSVPAKEMNSAIGYKAVNRKMLEEKFKTVIFKADDSLKNRDFHVDYH